MDINSTAKPMYEFQLGFRTETDTGTEQYRPFVIFSNYGQEIYELTMTKVTEDVNQALNMVRLISASIRESGNPNAKVIDLGYEGKDIEVPKTPKGK